LIKKPVLVLIILVAVLTFTIIPAAYAYNTSYRDARMFGKVITPQVIYGTLYYRNNYGEYVKEASKTYFRVQPLHAEHMEKLANQINKTVALIGRMNSSGTYQNPLFIYHDVKPAEYKIELQEKYYFSGLQGPQQAFGVELTNENALGDLIAAIKPLSNWPDQEELARQDKEEKEKLQKSAINYRKEYLTYQWLVNKNEDVQADIRYRIGTSTFIRGTEGNNILVDKADVGIGEMKTFIPRAENAGLGHRIEEEGPMTIYGTLYQNNISKKYYITGVAGYSLEHWLGNFKNEAPKGETWPLKNGYHPPKGIETGTFVWAVGNRVEKKDKEGNPTGVFYFSPRVYLEKEDFLKGLDYFTSLTSGELVL
jgi:hypothetical protein